MTDSREAKDRELFDSIALKYAEKDHYIVSSRARKFQLLSLVNLVDNLNGKQKSIKSMVELGCGSGAGAKYLEGRYDSYTGIDYSNEFIQIARAENENDRASFVCENIKEASKSTIFKTTPDLIFGVGVLHHCSQLEQTLNNIRELGDEKSLYAFIEPFSGNPFIECLRFLRKKTDKRYSEDQISFSKPMINRVFSESGFKILKIAYQGYLTPPFAQVMFHPSFIFLPLVNAAIKSDHFIQTHLGNRFSWNIMWVAQRIN